MLKVSNTFALSVNLQANRSKQLSDQGVKIRTQEQNGLHSFQQEQNGKHLSSLTESQG